MAFDQKGLDDYVDVAQRIADFRQLYPEGCLQPLDPTQPFEVRELTGTDKTGKQFTATMIVYVAAAYRDRDDPRPGIGCAWEPFPGRTTFTLGSELMNAETSAWGRAIIAVLASDSKRGVASREEVRNRNAEQEEPPKRKPRSAPPARPAGELPRNTDGSVSRSRTTDAELAATGQMTDQQLRDHNRLERDTKGTGPQGTQRLTETPPDDPWYDNSAPSGNPPRTVPVPRASNVAGVIHSEFHRLGFDDKPREARLGVMTAITGRTITSTNDLTAAEGLAVKRLISACRDEGVLAAKLLELQQEAPDA